MGLKLGVILFAVVLLAGCGSGAEGEAGLPEKDQPNAAAPTTTTTTSTTTTTTTIPPTEVAAQQVLRLEDMPAGYGWEVLEPQEPADPSSFDELVAAKLEDDVVTCLLRAPATEIDPLGEASTSFVQFPQPDLPNAELRHSVYVFADETQAAQVASAVSAQAIAACLDEVLKALDQSLSDAIADLGESYTPEPREVSAEPNDYLPGLYGDESDVSSVIIQTDSSFALWDVVTIRVGAVLSVVTFSQPVVDQEHDLLSIVASKMGGNVPEGPDLGPGD